MDESDFIDGVYNYCDRWCERCPLTSRCRLFAMEQEAFDTPESRDPENEAFWDGLHNVFEQTREMLAEMIREQGLDPDEVFADAAAEAAEADRRPAWEKYPLVDQAHRYTELVSEWFEARRALFEEKSDELVSQAVAEIAGTDPEAEAWRIGDAVDVIRWYQFQIAVKLARALEKEDFDDPDLREAEEYDANGSAKVALLGMDRSIAAWSILYESFPEERDSLLSILAHLNRLRRAAESAFPMARSFVRPGFDTGAC